MPGSSASDEKDARRATAALVAILAEVASPAARVGPSMRLLLRLDARKTWEAGTAVVRVLERRLVAEAPPPHCVPPAPAELSAARRSLADLAVVAPPTARWPTPAELDDLAYFYAAVADTGPEVGKTEEVRGGQPLPAGHPDLAARDRLRNEMRSALLGRGCRPPPPRGRGVPGHAGLPGPAAARRGATRRAGGGLGASSTRMRWVDAARSAEILGRYDVAEGLYRRANPGGGMCGTTTFMRRDAQIRGRHPGGRAEPRLPRRRRRAALRDHRPARIALRPGSARARRARRPAPLRRRALLTARPGTTPESSSARAPRAPRPGGRGPRPARPDGDRSLGHAGARPPRLRGHHARRRDPAAARPRRGRPRRDAQVGARRRGDAGRGPRASTPAPPPRSARAGAARRGKRRAQPSTP